MSLEGPNSNNCLTVDVSIVDGVRVFTPQEPAPENLSWNVNHRRMDIAKPGRYFLSLVADGFNLNSDPVEFNGSHEGISVYESTISQVWILISTSATAGERAEFWLAGTAPDGSREIIDPTILVDPPGGVLERNAGEASEASEIPTLTVKVGLGEDDQYAYAVKQTDTALGVVTGSLTATVEDYGTYAVIFDASFALDEPGIKFPDGQPDYITVVKERDTVTLTVQVNRGRAWPALVRLAIQKSHQVPRVPNEPTILVDPPGGKE